MSDYIIMEKLNEMDQKLDAIMDNLKINDDTEDDNLFDEDNNQDMDTDEGEM